MCTVPKELDTVHKDLAQSQDARHYPPPSDWRCIWCDVVVRGGVTHKCDKGPTLNFDHHK